MDGKAQHPFPYNARMSTNWQWRCSTCQHTAPAKGVFRIGTSGTSRTIGRCSRCDAWRVLVLEKAGTPAPANGKASGPSGEADTDRTWYELTAYVSEGSMSVETAEQIASSTAAEPRKREVAAHVAGGAMKAEDAVRLLQIK